MDTLPWDILEIGREVGSEGNGGRKTEGRKTVGRGSEGPPPGGYVGTGSIYLYLDRVS